MTADLEAADAPPNEAAVRQSVADLVASGELDVLDKLRALERWHAVRVRSAQIEKRRAKGHAGRSHWQARITWRSRELEAVRAAIRNVLGRL